MMIDNVFEWLLVLKNSKIVALLIFFATFLGIIIYTYGSRKRSERLESYRNIPFLDDDQGPRVPNTQESDASGKSGK